MESGKPPPTPAQKSSIDQIIHGGWYLLGLVNEILDLASIESGQLALALANESLADILADCQTMIEPQATARGIVVNFPVFAQPCLVQADRRRLKQVVINLLSNAIKYNRQHGTVHVTFSRPAPGQVRLSVQDDGLGLTPEQVANLFQPFNRLGQERGVQEGTGIGLAVSKRLVEMMGGRIGASSRIGVGSVFWFELVLAQGSV
jgi:signal transduction histidine kinase